MSVQLHKSDMGCACLHPAYNNRKKRNDKQTKKQKTLAESDKIQGFFKYALFTEGFKVSSHLTSTCSYLHLYQVTE